MASSSSSIFDFEVEDEVGDRVLQRLFGDSVAAIGDGVAEARHSVGVTNLLYLWVLKNLESVSTSYMLST